MSDGGSDWSSIRQAGSSGKHNTQSERHPFQARFLRRRQLKVHVNHRNFDQVKQTDRLAQNGNGIGMKPSTMRTVEFSSFTY